MKPRKKLVLRKELLQEIGADDLRTLAGGEAAATVTCTCPEICIRTKDCPPITRITCLSVCVC